MSSLDTIEKDNASLVKVEEKAPTKTDLWLSLRTHLISIDVVQQTFEVDTWLNLFWVDFDILQKGGSYINEKKGLIEILDDGENQPIKLDSIFESPKEFEIIGNPLFSFNAQTGVISATIHIKATLFETIEIERFPFDRQFLTIRLCIRTLEYNCLMIPPDYVRDKLNLRSVYFFSS